MPIREGMGTASVNNLSNDYLQSIISSSLQNAGVTNNQNTNSLNGATATSLAQQPDNGQLSPFAQMLSELQQLQQSNPTEYQQVTQQIATNLQSAAQTAQSGGNTTAANQLNQLATDFTKASTSGQLPNVQDLAQAAGKGGGHHHHHHAEAASSDSDASATASTAASAGTTSPLTQLLSALQTNGTQNESQNPISIILNTLSNAGVTG